MKSLDGIVGELVGLRAQERMHHELHAEAVIVQPVAAELLEVEVVRVAIVDVRVHDRAVRPRVVVVARDIAIGQRAGVQERLECRHTAFEVVGLDLRWSQEIARVEAVRASIGADLLAVAEHAGPEADDAGVGLRAELRVGPHDRARQRVDVHAPNIPRASHIDAPGQLKAAARRQNAEDGWLSGMGLLADRRSGGHGRLLRGHRRCRRRRHVVVHRAEDRLDRGSRELADHLGTKDRQTVESLHESLVCPARQHGVFVHAADVEPSIPQHRRNARRPGADSVDGRGGSHRRMREA